MRLKNLSKILLLTSFWFITSIAVFVLFNTRVEAATHNISITGMAYSPSSLNINVGDTVIWTNNDGMPHTVSSVDSLFDSGTINDTETFSHTFNSEGTFDYECLFHPAMLGSITVSAASGSPTPSTSTSTLPDTGLFDTPINGSLLLGVLMAGIGLLCLLLIAIRILSAKKSEL